MTDRLKVRWIGFWSLERPYAFSMKLNDENETFFTTEDMAAQTAAAGCEFKPRGHARTKSVRDIGVEPLRVPT